MKPDTCSPQGSRDQLGSRLRRWRAWRRVPGVTLYLLFAVVAVLLVAGTPNAYAQEGDEEEGPTDPLNVQTEVRGTTSLADIGFGDTRASGRGAVQQFFFPGPGDFQLGEGSRVVLTMSHSNLLDPTVSTVNVVMNDRPIQVIRLDNTNIEPTTYVVQLPQDVIQKDFNQLTLEYNMTMGLECENPNHPALFSTVHNDTRLVLEFAQNPPIPVLEEPNLVTYPYPFFRGGYPVVAPVTIVIPDNPSSAELTAAYRIAIDLATRVFFDLALLNVERVSQLTAEERNEHQLILVGTPQQPLIREALQGTTFGLNGDQLVRNGQVLEPEYGVLLLRESPWNSTLRTLLITGSTTEGVTRSIDAITSPEPSALFASAEAVLTQPIAPPSTSRQFASIFTLGDLGLGDQTYVGAAQNTYEILFSSPALAPGASAELDLLISTPQILDRNRSNVVAELNGVNVETLELENQQAQSASYRVNIPTDLVRIGPNTLRLRSQLYTEDPVEALGPCVSTAPERLWLTYHAESAIALPEAGGEVTVGADLASLPFPFSGLFGIAETTFVIDPESPLSLRGGMLTAIALGRRVNARPEFRVEDSTATSATIGDRHVVVVGLPADAPINQEIDTVLPLVFGPDGQRALVEEEETLTEILDTSRLGAIQEAPVPWARTRKLLVLSGTDDTALEWAMESIVSRGFDGNVALLQSPTLVQTFALQRLSDTELDERLEERFTAEESRLRTGVSFALVAVGALVILGVWGLRHRIRFVF